MAISEKIRCLVQSQKKTQVEIAKALGVSPQSLCNKMHRDTFTAADLVKISDALDCKLLFLTADGQEVVLDKSDLKKGEK